MPTCINIRIVILSGSVGFLQTIFLVFLLLFTQFGNSWLWICEEIIRIRICHYHEQEVKIWNLLKYIILSTRQIMFSEENSVSYHMNI